MKLSLVVGQGAHKGRGIPISLPQFVIGRDSKCHLRPVSQTISKRHCEVLTREDRVFVKDLGSTNGTFVNDEQVTEERELHDGDVLKIGPLDFGVRIEMPAPAPVAAEVQAEKPTQVEKETQAPPKVKAKPKAKAPLDPDILDEDAVGSMLLELTDEEEAKADDSLSGSTVMEMLQPQSEDEKNKQPYRPQVNKEVSTENTSSAAKAILEKYRRRPRA